MHEYKTRYYLNSKVCQFVKLEGLKSQMIFSHDINFSSRVTKRHFNQLLYSD